MCFLTLEKIKTYWKNVKWDINLPSEEKTNLEGSVFLMSEAVV